MKNNIFNEILRKVKNVNILEKLNNPQELLEYLELENNIKKSIDEVEVLNKKYELFGDKLSVKEKKKLIIQLANIDKIEAYQTLKKYSENPLSELSDFIKIALQESKALLQSSLLGEPSILITSLLGGKDNKLRFFALITKRDNEHFLPWQKNIIEKEILFWSNQKDGEIEELKIYDNFCTLVFLLPYNIPVHQAVLELINNINFFGEFINEKFMLRNDKILSEKESKEEAEKIINKEKDDNNKSKYISDIDNLTDDL